MLSAIAFAVVAAVAQPEMRTPRSIAIWSATGAALGVVLFGTIVAGESSRPVVIQRHGHRLATWAWFLGSMSLGHLVFRSIGDAGIIIALPLLFACVLLLMYLTELAKRSAA
ncbi:MAG TPA: hypothetical protein VGR35_20545 [Tepidisphaeraceae bacterium]|nr:hypothetical protein [Tepidisphaeraceae bacterium]